MEHVHGTFSTTLVVFSYLVSVAASYTVLDLTACISAAKGNRRWFWLLFGTVAMGMGIWSMHFVGMLAFELPVPVAYDLTLVLLSVLAALLGSLVALHMVGRRRVTNWQLVSAGLVLATGISAMHYIGMAAMVIDITYDPFWFTVSIAVAVAASISALWLSFYFRQNDSSNRKWTKFCSGLLMGAAIAGMHYTGMTAAHFRIGEKYGLSKGIMLDHNWLAFLITAGTLITLVMSLVGVFISRRFANKETALQENEKRYRSLYENTGEAIIFVGMEGIIREFNPSAAAFSGIEAAEMVNKPVSRLLAMIAEEERERTLALFRQALVSRDDIRYETALRYQGGPRVELSVNHIAVEIDGEVVGTYIIARDITEEKRAKEQMYTLAFHDELTGLPNRRKFNEELERAIEDALHASSSFAVMVMDIDRFKMINDSIGHTYGDQFLREVAVRLKVSLEGERVVIARMGGDEFTLLCASGYTGGELFALAERMIGVISQPYRLKENDFYVTASIGIAVFPHDGKSGLQLLKHADMAMYEIKKNGKNGFRFYSQELNTHVVEKIELESELRGAISRNELLLHYQPQIRAADNAMIGVEALARWNHPKRGMLSPSVFIPIAEESGMILEIGTWAIREACLQMKRWHDEGGPLIPVSVNLSSQQFHQANLVDHIGEILRESGLAPHYLELEITEGMMMDPNVSTGILRQLTDFGIRISLDDFGTGYSSLSYLKLYPINKVKIDRSFIRDITKNQNDKAIVATIIAMAQHLNMEVIAEGIETKDQLDILTANDCHEIQGYYYSKPLSPIEVEQAYFIPQRTRALPSVGMDTSM